MKKITYLRGSVDQRMNGACAGGTGAFIDRMASLLSVDAAGLGALAKKFPTDLPHRLPLRRLLLKQIFRPF